MYKLILIFSLVLFCFCLADREISAQKTEVKLPDGKTAVIKPDNTWEIKKEVIQISSNGKKILLFPDNTWQYKSNFDDTIAANFFKPGNATSFINDSVANFGIWYEKSFWHYEKSKDTTNKIIRHRFINNKNHSVAMVLYNKGQKSIDEMVNLAIENAKKIHPDSKILDQGKRVINGSGIYYIKFETFQGKLPIVYYNYIYVGPSGTIQLITKTDGTKFHQIEDKVEALLNGLVVFE